MRIAPLFGGLLPHYCQKKVVQQVAKGRLAHLDLMLPSVKGSFSERPVVLPPVAQAWAAAEEPVTLVPAVPCLGVDKERLRSGYQQILRRCIANFVDPLSKDVCTGYMWHGQTDVFANEYHAALNAFFKENKPGGVLVGVSGGLLDFACAMRASKVCLIDSNKLLPLVWTAVFGVLCECVETLPDSATERDVAEAFVHALKKPLPGNIRKQFTDKCLSKSDRREVSAGLQYVWKLVQKGFDGVQCEGSWANRSDEALFAANIRCLLDLICSGECYFFTRDLSEPGWSDEISREIGSCTLDVFHLSNVLDYVRSENVLRELQKMLPSGKEAYLSTSISGRLKGKTPDLEHFLGTVRNPSCEILSHSLSPEYTPVWDYEENNSIRKKFKYEHAMRLLLGEQGIDVNRKNMEVLWERYQNRPFHEAVDCMHGILVKSMDSWWAYMCAEKEKDVFTLESKRHIQYLSRLSPEQKETLKTEYKKVYGYLSEAEKYSITRSCGERLAAVVGYAECEGIVPLGASS